MIQTEKKDSNMFSEDEVLKLIEKANATAFKMFQSERYQEAEVILNHILKVSPIDIQSLQLMGLVKHKLGKITDAITIFKKVIEVDPDNVENYNNLGLCYSQDGKFEDAIKMLKTALDLNPSCAYIYSNLGLQYRSMNNLDMAIEYFQNAIAIEENALTWVMLGGCYGEKHDLDEAERCFKRAIEINPDFANGHVDLANIYHLKGEWEKAWEEYEWRDKVFEQLQVWKNLYDPLKRWKGQPLENKTIIVHGEQGIGDTIQFFRYIQYLKGARVILHCSSRLSSIFDEHVDGICTKEPNEMKIEDLPTHDYHCSILSLPYLLKLKEVPPFQLKVKNSINLDRYADSIKIGIVWAGNPQHPNDINRSCHLQYFREIHDMPNVKLFSLMKDIRPRIYRFNCNPIDLTDGTEDMKIVDMAPMMDTFADTAEIINSLDLVITVDTSVLHLAGSMGKPTWAILPWTSDWRWGSAETTVWYPSVRIFRQPSKGDWKSVFSNIKKEITMNKDYVEKNLVYQDQIEKIAKQLYHSFYNDEKNEYGTTPEETIKNLLPMAEKMFNFFETASEAKKTIRFLHTINPIKAKEIFDEL